MGDSNPPDELVWLPPEEVVPEDAPSVAAMPGTAAEASAQASPDAEVARARQEAEEWREAYLRKLAEFDNSRKRQEREMSEYRRTANAALVRELLPVVDNLERALAASGDETGGIFLGVSLVLRQLKDVLGRSDVVELDPVGQGFDPALHEAVSRLETADAEPDTVVQVLQKGYRYGERLLRPAMVVVAAPTRGVEPLPAPDGERGET